MPKKDSRICDCLPDSVRRCKYNEFGPKESAPEGGYIDPEEMFGAVFRGERFVPIIGTISLAKDMKSALQEAEDGEEADENSGQPRLERYLISGREGEEKRKRQDKGREGETEGCWSKFYICASDLLDA